ncbi:MAG: bifunctional methylenetetrahydrofolate dehydrogenase/methenyltetrahydrofolate cyclohydrolase [Proteobacteria bacterium]|nr:bifunctional methylenetetrahydrofolate dehydrogenase/methenyltetrahydrofolate cyclohydrolase [Pseudomonadota bacterium]
MQTRIIDGVAIARELRAGLKPRISRLGSRGVVPGLAVIQLGDSPASAVYVRNKLRACAEAGMHSQLVSLPSGISQGELLAHIDALNQDPRIHGILLQLPLPPQIASNAAMHAIAEAKDVDGFHPQNAGALMLGGPAFLPCTPYGVMKLLEHEGIAISGRHAVVIGRSNIVGKPMAMLLLQAGATVTICHSKTADLGHFTRQADIVVAAVGKLNLVTAGMIKEGSAVIDVAINRTAEGKLAGDCDFAGLLGEAGWITPVPGGVGPMTVTMLLFNTVQAAENSIAAAK